jgi:hypothetical protein
MKLLNNYNKEEGLNYKYLKKGEHSRNLGLVDTREGKYLFEWFAHSFEPKIIEVEDRYKILRIDDEYIFFDSKEKLVKRESMFMICFDPIITDEYIILQGELGIKILSKRDLRVLCNMDGLPDVYKDFIIDNDKVIVTTLDGSEYSGKIKKNNNE